jgi:hypothetical protein
MKALGLDPDGNGIHKLPRRPFTRRRGADPSPP